MRSGCSAAQAPMTKNVASTRCCASTSRICGVRNGLRLANLDEATQHANVGRYAVRVVAWNSGLASAQLRPPSNGFALKAPVRP